VPPANLLKDTARLPISVNQWSTSIEHTQVSPLSTLTLPISMEEFLKQLKLECYWDTFRENCFDELDSLEDLSEGALDKMGVALGHKGG